MKTKMSPNIAVKTDKFQEAVDFYSRVLGFENRSGDPDMGDFDAHPLNMFVMENLEMSGLVLELFVEDLEEARNVVAKG